MARMPVRAKDGLRETIKSFAEHITSAFIVGPEGLPLEDFFSIDLKTLFRKQKRFANHFVRL